MGEQETHGSVPGYPRRASNVNHRQREFASWACFYLNPPRQVPTEELRDKLKKPRPNVKHPEPFGTKSECDQAVVVAATRRSRPIVRIGRLSRKGLDAWRSAENVLQEELNAPVLPPTIVGGVGRNWFALATSECGETVRVDISVHEPLFH